MEQQIVVLLESTSVALGATALPAFYRLKDTKLTLPSEKTENKAHEATNNVAHNSVAGNGPLFSDR
jgi:hypothetical protein